MIRLQKYKIYGKVFTNQGKAVAYRNYWNKAVKKNNKTFPDSPINLRYRILKRKKRYIVTEESKKR